MNDAVSRAAEALKSARRVVALTGAGVSKESGVPTYRDALAGLWANHSFEDLASPEGFRRDPAMVWDWYAARRSQLREVRPNAGHYALARIATHFPDFVTITQNVDDLHERGGSRDIIHLHGHLMETKCFFDCRGSSTLVDEAVFAGSEGSPPPCPHCGRWLRPNVVWFGEMLPPEAFRRAQQAAATCEVMLVIGTSGLVYPAAGLPMTAELGGAVIIEINPEDTDISRIAAIRLRGASGEILPQLAEALGV